MLTQLGMHWPVSGCYQIGSMPNRHEGLPTQPGNVGGKLVLTPVTTQPTDQVFPIDWTDQVFPMDWTDQVFPVDWTDQMFPVDWTDHHISNSHLLHMSSLHM